MSDEQLETETQRTDAAEATYRRSGEALLSALQTHMEITIKREHNEDEPQDYLRSRKVLEEAAEAFNDAEYDWCGSFPLRVVETPEDADDAENEDGAGQVVSVVRRQDYGLVDAEAVLEAGRSSYLYLWTEATSEDAERAVTNVADAVGEFAHANGWEALIECPGLEGGPDATTVLVHGGDGWWDDDSQDPFAIVGQ